MHAIMYLLLRIKTWFFAIRREWRTNAILKEFVKDMEERGFDAKPVRQKVSHNALHIGRRGLEAIRILKHDKHSGRMTCQVIKRPHVIFRRRYGNPCITHL